MTIKDIIDNIPDWIKIVEKRKGFSNTLISRGWDWDHLYINGDNAIKLLFEYHYSDGIITSVEAKMANTFFQSEPINLDHRANIPTKQLKQDELTKIRLMYLFFYIHQCFNTRPILKTQPNKKLILEVEASGDIEVKTI